jgi:hypothetical protein
MRKLILLGIAALILWALPITIKPTSWWAVPSITMQDAEAITYRRARVSYRRGYRRAARYSAYVAGSTAGYYGNPYGYAPGGGFGGYSYGGYGGYAYPYSTSYYGGYGTPGMYRRAYRRAY